jgi:hypothetical protein
MRSFAVLFALSALPLVACSPDYVRPLNYDKVAPADRTRLEDAFNKQIQLGYQIRASAASDNIEEQCHEMCLRSRESCDLTMVVCDMTKKYPGFGDFVAKCEVSRERCRLHVGAVPRECACETATKTSGTR